MAIKESKDLTSLSVDELIGNLKVYEVIIKNDSEMVKGKREQNISLALKAKKKQSDEDSSNSGSEDEEYTMDGKSERKCFRCGDPNHFIRECPKSSRSNNQKAFIGGAWSDSSKDEKEKAKDENGLVAQASNDICLGINLDHDEWIKDSGCSKHMTDNQKLLSTYKAYNGGNVIFGSNLRGNIIGKGMIPHDSLIIENVEHVDNLKFNLLSVGQICDNKSKVEFTEHDSEIIKDEKVIVPNPMDMTIIGTKSVFRNKLDENGVVSRNKARLVAQGYNQQEGIDYDETYAPVARLESIKILLACARALDFKLFQMDVNSAFLNGFINEEVYVADM
nr:copia protein [Tanacetum cinerariifolium]